MTADKLQEAMKYASKIHATKKYADGPYTVHLDNITYNKACPLLEELAFVQRDG